MEKKSVKWTDAQLEAISHRKGGAIVSAAAGSGKTAVLSQRLIEMICDSENPLNPEKAAVITFTEKAAGELKARLARLMKQRMAENPTDAAFLRTQTAKLKNARISTISSFCFGLLRENADLSPLPPGFAVMDEIRAEMLKNSVMENLLEDFYSRADDETVATVCDYWIGKDDSELADTILKIHTAAVNIPDYDNWLEFSRSREWFEIIRQDIKAKAKDAHEASAQAAEEYEDSIGFLEKPEKQEEYARLYRSTCLAALDVLSRNDYIYCADADDLLADAPSKTPAVRDPNVKYYRELMKENAATCVSYSKRLADFDDEVERYLPALNIMTELVKQFDKMYREEKNAQNIADFSDAEQGLYSLLKAHPEISRRTGLQIIVVDEFQDSNEIQYEIFRMLSDNEENLYFVGDIKQSIYGFRGARPDVFASVAADEKYRLLPLNTNFRSAKPVIDGVNMIFDCLMTKSLGGTDYSKNDRLELGRTETEINSENAAEVVTVRPTDNCGMTAHEAEARYVAGRIRKMIDEGFTVEGRPCTEGDFAVLMRSPRSKTELYINALRAQGLRVSAQQAEPFEEAPEIRLMRDFLTVLDNPYNDEALARLMMSVAYGFDAERMARIRTGTTGFDISALKEYCAEELEKHSAEYTAKPLFTCLIAAAEGRPVSAERYPKLCGAAQSGLVSSAPDEKSAFLLGEIYRLRSFMAANSPSELIRCIYDTTQVRNLLLICDNPAQRSANLSMLISLAKVYTYHRGGGTVGDFLTNLFSADSCRSPILQPSVLGNEGVRIMSVHASKGLEFPVCFVCNCDKNFNYDELHRNTLVSRRFGIAGKITDKTAMTRIPSPAYEYAANELKAALRSEELRLLYVAATRAREKLIFTGVRAKGMSDIAAFCNTARPDTSKSNYLAWLYEVAKLAQNAGEENNGSIVCRGGALVFTEAVISEQEQCGQTEISENVTVNEENVRVIEESISLSYRYAPLGRIAAKYTATQLAVNSRLDKGVGENCELYIARPDFSAREKPLSAKQRGDAYHKVMQHISFDKPLDKKGVEQQLLKLSDILTEKERKAVKAEDIVKFFRTDIAARMIKSGRIYREQPVFHRLSPELVTAAQLGIDEEDREALLNTDSGEAPYLQGVADMLFIENDSIILIDYKTDSFSDEERLLDDYKFQLELYAQALEAMFSMKVTERYIYSFKMGKMINADSEEQQ